MKKKKTKVNLYKKYIDGQKKREFKKGKFVRILRKARSKERGWQNVWSREMSKYVGQIGRIESVIQTTGGIGITFNKGSENERFFHFPYFILRKVTKPKHAAKKVGIQKNYSKKLPSPEKMIQIIQWARQNGLLQEELSKMESKQVREAQCSSILKHLRSGKTITPLEALKKFGSFRLSARIYDLRHGKSGFSAVRIPIKTTIITSIGWQGQKKSYAKYSLMRKKK